MKIKQIGSGIGLLLCCTRLVTAAAPLGTAFTYQGRLNDGATPAQGSYDLRFVLYDALSGGAQVGNSLTNAATGVTNGYFTVTLDFGAVFNANARWLEIGVRTNGSGAFVILAPRQPVTASPYALYTPNAGAAATATTAASANSVAAANVTGTLALGQLPSAVLTNNAKGVTLGGTFNGNGAGLTNLNATQVSSGTVADARLSTNVALLNANQVFTGSNRFVGAVTMTNAANTFAGNLSPTSVTSALAAANQSAVPSGGVVLSANSTDTNLLNAGYVRLGLLPLRDWEQRATATALAGSSVHTAVWTGTEMIVWGGAADGSSLQTGGRYNPTANSWTAMTTNGAPAARNEHTAGWTGKEMIVWGGYGSSTSLNDTFSYTPFGTLYLYQRQ